MNQFPQIIETNVDEAHRFAMAESVPVFFPIKAYCDDRGWSLMNLLHGTLQPEGQINFSHQYPGVVKAWHRHKLQTDFWICVEGHIKAGVYREDDNAMWTAVFGQIRPGILIVPPTLWHGATAVGGKPAGLLYYVTHAYDPANPDEERRAYDSVEGFHWEPEHK